MGSQSSYRRELTPQTRSRTMQVASLIRTSTNTCRRILSCLVLTTLVFDQVPTWYLQSRWTTAQDLTIIRQSSSVRSGKALFTISAQYQWIALLDSLGNVTSNIKARHALNDFFLPGRDRPARFCLLASQKLEFIAGDISNDSHLEPLRAMCLRRGVYDIMQFGPILSRGLV